ncbi:hypothetical protein BR93DRAFT_967639 [Coniochaeta sp. PMI_546]|nr:hypothetical protein BR93DRAFT_967639 [Coniochaeta sp. PMI_546]
MSVNQVKSISQAVATVAGKYGMVTVAYVQETDAWRRTFLSSKAAADFTVAVEKEANEKPHESEKDARTHWTVFAVKNNDLNQGTTRHIV